MDEIAYLAPNTQKNTNKRKKTLALFHHYLLWQRLPGHMLWVDIDLKLCLHLFKYALAVLIM